MSPLLIKISKDFATLFTTINPIATLALFAGLTASLSRAERHWTALRACIYATIILVAAGQVIETRSLPTLTRSYPRRFTFYVADPSAPFSTRWAMPRSTNLLVLDQSFVSG